MTSSSEERPVAASLILPLVPPAARPEACPHSPDLLRRGLLKLLDDGGGEAAVGLVHEERGAGGLPWTVSAAWGPPGRHRFRLTVLGTSLGPLARALRDALRSGSTLLHGWTVAPTNRWLVRGTGGVERLARVPAGGDDGRLLVLFLSPTATRRPGDRADRALDGVIELVASWRRRWLKHAGPAHPLTALIGAGSERGSALLDWCADHLEVTDSRTEIRRWRAADGVLRPGTIGWVALHCRRSDGLERAALRALARFALFAGTGKHLSFGFGQTLALVGEECDALPRGWGLPLLSAVHRPLARPRTVTPT